MKFVIDQQPFWPLLTPGAKVRLVVSSDPRGAKEWTNTLSLVAWFQELGLVVEMGRAMKGPESYSPRARAQDVNEAFADPDAAMIFDVSGGTLANGTVEFIDFEAAGRSGKPYFGFSNVSDVLNTLLDRASLRTGLYDVMRTVYDRSGRQKELFLATFMELWPKPAPATPSAGIVAESAASLMAETKVEASVATRSLFSFEVEKFQGDSTEGVLAGGNIRSILQLAGTPYWPDFTDKILLLESLGGDEKRADSQFWQLRQMGVFGQIKGVILGQFTEAKEERGLENVLAAVVEDPAFPIWRTEEIGHSLDSQALIVGETIALP